jgi:NTP pyrophosphatase (non-canonical NTP hydrolase)
MSEFYFHKLSAAELERLAILSEEMGEAQQVIGKIIRHGYESCDPTLPVPDDERPPTNLENLEKELGDVVFAINLLGDDIDQRAIGRRVLEKQDKIRPYLHHQTVPKH